MPFTEAPGAARNAIDGVVPRTVLFPDSAEELAAMLASASHRRASVVIRGGGTKLGWGRTPAPIDALLCTERLNAVVAHEYADLTATIQAGARIDDVNRTLALHGQWLPIESPFEGATIGGAIATNDGGPLRHRYGTPRDLVIGVRLALTDGRLVKAGGNVVKNVAGYDLGKLISGSFGSLAAIVSATFKLSPVPAASNTMVAAFTSAVRLAAAVRAIADSQLEAAACEVQAGFDRPCRLLMKFESTAGALQAHVNTARSLIGPAECRVVAADDESVVWREHGRTIWGGSGTVVKASWLPASLGAVLQFLEEIRAGGVAIDMIGRAGLGSGVLRVTGDLVAERRTIEAMRARHELFRHVVVLRAVPDLKGAIDMWGPPGAAAALGAALKVALDPAGILNAGRGPL